MTVCPLECIYREEKSFIQKHETFILTLVATLSGTIGVILTYFLKSRCKRINCCCISCDRDVLAVENAVDLQITNT